jgi:chemotaxis protein methyltransferase CheR
MGNETSFATAPPELSQSDFERITALAREHFGIVLSEGKEQLVSARLAKKLTEHNLRSYHQYYKMLVEDRTGSALCGLADALTTNFTDFFREPVHFTILREFVKTYSKSHSRLRLWCAAAATGEEPYSLAITLLEELGRGSSCKPSIDASDISNKALKKAREMTYAADRLKLVPADLVKSHFLRGEGQWKGFYRVKPETASLVTYHRINLIEPLPEMEPFAVIFCRNVMIYFDKQEQERVVNRLEALLEPGGLLFIGHAEGLVGLKHNLQYLHPAVYQKPSAGLFGARR